MCRFVVFNEGEPRIVGSPLWWIRRCALCCVQSARGKNTSKVSRHEQLAYRYARVHIRARWKVLAQGATLPQPHQSGPSQSRWLCLSPTYHTVCTAYRLCGCMAEALHQPFPLPYFLSPALRFLRSLLAWKSSPPEPGPDCSSSESFTDLDRPTQERRRFPARLVRLLFSLLGANRPAQIV